MMPRVDIGELILEVMSWQPRFLQALTALSGGESRLDNLNVSMAAALTAQALNVGYGEAHTRVRISHVDQSYLRADTVAPDNAPLINAQADIALARDHWGGGLVAAVDASASLSRCAASTPVPIPSTSGGGGGEPRG